MPRLLAGSAERGMILRKVTNQKDLSRKGVQGEIINLVLVKV